MTPDAPDWEGQMMVDRAGKKIGTIKEIYVVQESGRPEWGLVKLGRIKSRMTLVPLAGARPGAEGVRAAYDKTLVKDAPGVDSDGEPSQQQVTEIYRHYGIDYDDNAQQTTAETPSDTRASGSQQHAKQNQHRGASRQTSRGASRNPSAGSTLKRTVKEFSADNLTHWAAALTYYGVLSIFPALLAIVSILGLFGSSAIQPMIDNLSTVAPGPAKQILTGALQGLQQGGGAGLLFIVALAGAIWRHRGTSARSWTPQTPSMTSKKAARSGKSCRCASRSPC
jgi:hypothetical protein